MAKMQIFIKGNTIAIETGEGFAKDQCIKVQDLLGGSFSAKGVNQVRQEMTVNADHDREEAVPEHVHHNQ